MAIKLLRMIANLCCLLEHMQDQGSINRCFLPGPFSSHHSQSCYCAPVFSSLIYTSVLLPAFPFLPPSIPPSSTSISQGQTILPLVFQMGNQIHFTPPPRSISLATGFEEWESVCVCVCLCPLVSPVEKFNKCSVTLLYGMWDCLACSLWHAWNAFEWQTSVIRLQKVWEQFSMAYGNC